jgi:hypothetical protein
MAEEPVQRPRQDASDDPQRIEAGTHLCEDPIEETVDRYAFHRAVPHREVANEGGGRHKETRGHRAAGAFLGQAGHEGKDEPGRRTSRSPSRSSSRAPHLRQGPQILDTRPKASSATAATTKATDKGS